MSSLMSNTESNRSKFNSVNDMFHQTHSPFFKLPFEVRSLIYDYHLTGHILYIKGRYDRGPSWHTCPPSTCSVRRFFDTFKNRGLLLKKQQILSLTKSCRRIYLETVNVIYEQNFFAFNDVRDFEGFRTMYAGKAKACTGPCGLTPQIRHLKLDSCAHYDLLAWDIGCIASSMSGVKVLHLPWDALCHWDAKQLEDNIRELVQVKGIHLSFRIGNFGNPEGEEVDALRTAWKELIVQPKTGDEPARRTERERKEALRVLSRKSLRVFQVSRSGSETLELLTITKDHAFVLCEA